SLGRASRRRLGASRRRSTGRFRRFAGRRGRPATGRSRVRAMKKNLKVLLVAFVSCPLAAAAVFCAPDVARAEDASSELGVWEGTGVASEIGGKEIGPFTVTLTRRAIAPGRTRTDGQVHTSDGKDIPFWQETT